MARQDRHRFCRCRCGQRVARRVHRIGNLDGPKGLWLAAAETNALFRQREQSAKKMRPRKKPR